MQCNLQLSCCRAKGIVEQVGRRGANYGRWDKAILGRGGASIWWGEKVQNDVGIAIELILRNVERKT
jgi:hypothetical protein